MSCSEKRSDTEFGSTVDAEGCAELRLQVPEHLAAAFQRCSWILVQEKGQDRLETMEEMVRDFLVKYGC